MPLQIDRNSVRAPTQSLNPTGLPPDSLRSAEMNSMSSIGVRKALCAGGETTLRPTWTPRVAAISGLTLAPGSKPPSPGLAPWDSFIDMALTAGMVAFSVNVPGSKHPSESRHPKYPEPISQIRSPPCR